ncbi:choline ABC transporter permease subunit [Palleronia sp. LCG004]|uniref:choline ABC transporter permease subunit n=1 Tax=Palleronia sp. LCG004 TaxID=3079304 RepID=UPI002943BF74|nr:choline ABC transporter permease subunit [Palleronia sp. LCG004]WOI56887.1 choline ABC transporter permease subunit [Palleronia sp. LCG004]
MEWLTDTKIPVGRIAGIAFDWLQINGAAVFDGIAIFLEGLIDILLALFLSPPGIGWLTGAEDYVPAYPAEYHPLLVIAVFAGLTWYLQHRWQVCLLVILGFLFVLNQGYWEETSESLTLVLSACVVCMGLGVPIGIAVAHRPKLYAWVRPVLDLMQTLPTFVYLIPAIVFFGIGMVPGLMATVIFVLPASIRLTHLGISSTPKPLIEAAQAFGATPRQLLWKIELPSALPQIMAGLNQTIMLSLSMVVIAALVGADGLGVPVVRALNQVNTSLGFESGFVIVVVAIILDRALRVRQR